MPVPAPSDPSVPQPPPAPVVEPIGDWWREEFARPTVQLHFGLDAFSVREGRGRPIEDAIRRQAAVYAEIAVTRSGRARVRALAVEGVRVE